jgi:hypothetical protein
MKKTIFIVCGIILLLLAIGLPIILWVTQGFIAGALPFVVAYLFVGLVYLFCWLGTEIGRL